jgi:hypothetical protein
MKVLVACECSGRVKTAFRNKGHDAWSCDIKPSEIPNDPYHLQCDVRDILGNGWDLMIAHPDCSLLANSGARWLFEKPGRWDELAISAKFFNLLKNQPIPKICIENPQPHKWATELIGHYDQKIQPWWFGEGETKGTCLWLKGLPPLMATYIHTGRIPRVHHEPPSPNQKANRARTYLGIAKAMADQWG